MTHITTKVIKRDGIEKEFDRNRIKVSIEKAAIAAGKTVDNIEELVGKIESKFNKEEVTVEEIQEQTEHVLMLS